MKPNLKNSHSFCSLIFFSKQKLHGSGVVDYSLALAGIITPQNHHDAKLTSLHTKNA